jgi:hypothetical protein
MLYLLRKGGKLQTRCVFGMDLHLYVLSLHMAIVVFLFIGQVLLPFQTSTRIPISARELWAPCPLLYNYRLMIFLCYVLVSVERLFSLTASWLLSVPPSSRRKVHSRHSEQTSSP